MNFQQVLISKQSVAYIAGFTFIVLCIPLLAMQLTTEVNWGVGDFIAATLLLSFFGYLYTLLTQASNNPAKKIIVGIILLALFLFVWIALAIDLF